MIGANAAMSRSMSLIKRHTARSMESQSERLQRTARRVALLIGVWTLCWLPLELWMSTTRSDFSACLLANGVWIALVVGVIRQSRTTRVLFACLCGASVVAIGLSLPSEYRLNPYFCALSGIELVLKAVALLVFVQAFAKSLRGRRGMLSS